jgi:sugar/nucleoside kinase (ribokinase family)
MVDVVAIGNVVNDFSVGPIDKLPGFGQIFSVERMKPVLGGNPSNMASGLGKMGVHVKVIGVIGQDMFGDFILERLRACGVDVSGIRRSADAQTPTTIGFVNMEGDRGFLHCFGTHALITEEDYDLSEYSAPTVFYMGGIEILPRMRGKPAGRIMEQAKKRGLTTVMDIAYDPLGEWLPVIEPSLPLADILFLGMAEAKIYAATEEPLEILKFFSKYGNDKILLKMGERGCLAYEEGRVYRIGVPEVQVKDTMGAGDNFVAGYLAGMVKGFSSEDCVKLGVAAGSLSTECFGGEAGYSNFEQVWSVARSLQIEDPGESSKRP